MISTIKKQKRISGLWLFSLIAFLLPAQHHTPVFTGISGQDLLENLVDSYKPSFVFDYGDARDTLFAKVYMHDDSLTCVYSGHTVYLNPNEDPTTTVYMNGSNSGINTEHTYPQGLGASSGNARSDMHHLFPTRTPVNAARANFPFAEVSDNQTIEWFYLNDSQSSIPSQNIDAFSEQGAGIFEPREDHKGNVARAMFYFYTMYKSQADAADPNYFEDQKETLCDWHLQDPIDDAEWERNLIIASYQSGKANPFILDCTLAERSYCAEFNQSCDPPTVPTKQIEKTTFTLYQNIPNPIFSSTRIRYKLDRAFDVRLKLYDMTGKLCNIIVDRWQPSGVYEVEINGNKLVAGVLYTYQLELFDGSDYHIASRKLLKL